MSQLWLPHELAHSYVQFCVAAEARWDCRLRLAVLRGQVGNVEWWVQSLARAVGLDGVDGTCGSRYEGQRRGGDAEEGVWERVGGLSSQDEEVYPGYILIKKLT